MRFSSSLPIDLSSGLPDLLAPNLKVMFCGINPGLRAATHGHHFIGRGNRFWRVLHLAGFTPIQILPEFDRSILEYGYGLTTAVCRPTARAEQLAKSEFSNAAAELAKKISKFSLGRVAFLGKPAFAAMYQKRAVAWGCQPEVVAGIETWVLPNPSGLNRGFRLDDLVAAYQELHLAIK
jgi:TDG/mug DNA glycosylase family protein